jgi:hypothetical protein
MSYQEGHIKMYSWYETKILVIPAYNKIIKFMHRICYIHIKTRGMK